MPGAQRHLEGCRFRNIKQAGDRGDARGRQGEQLRPRMFEMEQRAVGWQR